MEEPYGQHLSSESLKNYQSLGRDSGQKECHLCTSPGRSVFLLVEESRTPAVQRFEGSAEMMIFLDVGLALKARCDAVLSPFSFFIPYLFQDFQVLQR